MKKILIVFDGGSGLPHSSLAGKTPFEAAKTPNLDFFAFNGKMGYMYTVKKGIIPGSDNALISMFGNDSRISNRGVLEAIGAGFDLKRGDLALRTNFGTIDNLKNRNVIDRRAGRTLSSREALILAGALNKKIKLPIKFKFKPTIQHRGVLVLRGGFSDNITNIDSEWIKPGVKEKTFKFSEPLDEEDNSKHTVNILNKFVEQAFNILNSHSVNQKRRKRGLFPANMVFMRGAGSEIPKIKQYKNWMSINSMPLEVGIAKLSGMKNFSFDIPKIRGIDVYRNLYASLNKKIKFAIKIIKKNHKDFLGSYIQFKETDVPGHDNKPLEKKKMIEIIDRGFFRFLKKFVEKNDLKVVVTCDHSTPCKLKSHSAHPVPVLVYPNFRKDREIVVKRFIEKDARNGELGSINGREFIKKVGLQ